MNSVRWSLLSLVRQGRKVAVASSVLATLALGAGAEPAETVASPAPFESVVVRGDKIVASLPARLRLQVTEGDSKPRLTQPGEAFTLAPGTSLLLTERHSSYLITAQVEPTSGVNVSATIDARSTGGALSRKHYFIRASR